MQTTERDVKDLIDWGREMDKRPELIIAKAAELLSMRDRHGKIRALEANAVQRVFEQNYGQRNIVLKARQMGITTWVAARFFLKTITAPGVLTVQVAQTREAAEGIFRMVQRFWECLDDDLRKGPLRRSRANAGQMRFPELDSEFRILSAGDEAPGRGLTIQYLHCSELSRWPGDAQETLAGLRAALSPTGHLVMESTPNGAHGCFYNEWRRAKENNTIQHFFPWWDEPAYVSAEATNPTKEESELMAMRNLSLGQIGFRRSLAANFRGLRVQEFAEDSESCFKASGDCCFEIDAIERRFGQTHEPLWEERTGALHIFLPCVGGAKYIVAVDTAGGGSDGDYAAVQVIDLKQGVQCAELQQRINPLEQARVAAMLARRYNNAPIAVERNNHGTAVLAYLSTSEQYPHIYESNGIAGWLTSAANKPAMISRLGALLVESPEIFASQRLLAECRSFVNHPGGRTGAATGAHDDCVMAMAIAQAVRAEMLTRKK